MYRDEIIEQLRRKIKRQQTNLAISQEQLLEMEDLREVARKIEGKAGK